MAHRKSVALLLAAAALCLCGVPDNSEGSQSVSRGPVQKEATPEQQQQVEDDFLQSLDALNQVLTDLGIEPVTAPDTQFDTTKLNDMSTDFGVASIKPLNQQREDAEASSSGDALPAAALDGRQYNKDDDDDDFEWPQPPPPVLYMAVPPTPQIDADGRQDKDNIKWPAPPPSALHMEKPPKSEGRKVVVKRSQHRPPLPPKRMTPVTFKSDLEQALAKRRERTENGCANGSRSSQRPPAPPKPPRKPNLRVPSSTKQ